MSDNNLIRFKKMDDGMNEKSFYYNDLGRMTKVDNGLTTLGSYTFNPDNSRRSKTEGGTTTIFFYDFENIIGEYDSDWSSMRYSFTHGPGIDDILGMTDYTSESPVNCSGVNPAVDSS